MSVPTLRVRDRWLRIVDNLVSLTDQERQFRINTMMGQEPTEGGRLAIALELAVAAGWAANGKQSITMSHTLAASLIATDTPTTQPPPLPWPSFELQVPSGLLSTSKDEIHSMVVAPLPSYLCQDKGIVHYAILMLWNTRESFVILDPSKPQSETTKMDWGDMEWVRSQEPEAERVLLMGKRFLLNTCFAMAARRPSEAGATAEAEFRTKLRVTTAGIPTHTLEPTRPLELNLKEVRKEVQAYVRGERASVSISTMVRGHWRNQAHGPGRALRRPLWIRPFYRGNGPLVGRPVYLFGEAPELEEADGQQATG